MNKPAVLALLLLCLASCEQLPSTMTNRPIFLAKGHISFLLPDSSLTYGKYPLWLPLTPDDEYGETGACYHNSDSSVMVSVHVTAFPDSERRNLPWQILASKKGELDVLDEKTHGLATVERYKADSTSRTIEIDYRLPKPRREGGRGQTSFNKSLTIYGAQRVVEFWFSAPDDPAHRLAVAAARASVRIDTSYLHGTVRLWSNREYRD